MKKTFQAMKRVLSLIMVFAMLISFMPPATAQAANSVSGGNVYFDNSATQWQDDYLYFVIGHNSWSSLYRMTKVDETGNLYKVSIPKWDGSTYYAIIGTSNAWGEGGWGPSNLTNASHYTAAYTNNYGLNSGNNYVFVPGDSANGTKLTINWYGTTPYGVSVTNSENGTVETSKTVEEKGNTVTLTVTPNTGYELDGLIVMNGDTPVSVTNNSFQMPAGNVTVSATFKKVSYGVIFNGTNVMSSMGVTSKATHGEKYETTLTAAEGYALPEAVTVTVGGEAATHDYDAATGRLTVSNVTGEVVITAVGEKIPAVYNVTFNGTNVTSNGAATVTEGSDYTAQLSVESGYSLPDFVEITGASEWGYDRETGELFIQASYNKIQVNIFRYQQAMRCP